MYDFFLSTLFKRLLILCICTVILKAEMSSNVEKEQLLDRNYLRYTDKNGNNLSKDKLDVFRRGLSIVNDWFTGQSLKTRNGRVPRTACPIGFYRPAGGTDLKSIIGLRADGCVQCPRGRYGSTIGLTDSACTGPCPIGTYSDLPGLVDVTLCKLCPPGRYGAVSGLKSIDCTGACPAGRYSPEGSASGAACLVCDGHFSGKTGLCTQVLNPKSPPN